MEKKKIYGLMVLATLFWAGAFIAGKYTVPYIPVFTLTFLRFFFAAIVLYGVMRGTHHSYQLQKTHIPVFLLTGIIGMFGYHILFFTSLKYTTAIHSSIIGAMNPIVTVVLAFILLKQRLTLLQVFGVVLSFIGVFLTITGANIEAVKELSFNKGDLIMLCAVFCWALYGIISSKAFQNENNIVTPIVLTFYSFVVCLIVLVPFVIWEKPWNFISHLSLTVWMAVLYMSIFPSVIGYLVQQLSIKEIGPGRTSIFINLVPVFSIILAMLLLNEILEPFKIITALLIIAGVIITQKESI